MWPAELEAALRAHPDVADVAVGGVPDERLGEVPRAFVVLKGPMPSGEAAQKIAKELRDWVAHEIGPIAKPRQIMVVAELPKTRSQKVVRRAVRAVLLDEDPGDLSTLENPSALDSPAERSNGVQRNPVPSTRSTAASRSRTTSVRCSTERPLAAANASHARYRWNET